MDELLDRLSNECAEQLKKQLEPKLRQLTIIGWLSLALGAYWVLKK